MLTGNQIEKAFAKHGVEPEKPRKARKPKQFNCKKCGTVMSKVEGDNFMVCPECGNYFIFNK